MSERLEEIKKRLNSTMLFTGRINGKNQIVKDIAWIIEQAERAFKNAQDLEDMDKQLASEQKRVEELEKENKELSGILQIERNAHDFNFELLKEAEEENKRYKEAIKEILNNFPIPNYDLIPVNTLFEIHLICKQVLDEVGNEQ